MPLVGILLVALACSPKPAPEHRPAPDSAPTAIGSDTAPTVDTGPVEPPYAIMAESPPTAMVYGLPEMGAQSDFGIVPATGDASSVLLINNGHSDDGIEPFVLFPPTFALPGVVPPGEHLVTELWDGVSGLEDVGDYHPAGDVNDDGHLDLWGPRRLYLGPFLGKHTALADAHAWIDGPNAIFDKGVELANFDANGDGHEDVMFVPCCQMGVIRYGPFDGPITSYWDGFNASDTTLLGNETGCDSGPRYYNLLPNHLGPGHHAVSIVTGYVCYPDGHIYDLMQQPGTRVSPLDAVATAEGGAPVKDATDLDADGHPDVLHFLFTAGPVSGWLDELPAPKVSLVEEIGVSIADVYQALGDLDGDGITEFLLLYRPMPDTQDQTLWRWAVLFSPYDEPTPRPRAVALIPYLDAHGYSAEEGWSVGDLDGDGLPDLVHASISEDDDDPPPPPHLVSAGELRVWYAKDIVAAYQAALTEAN